MLLLDIQWPDPVALVETRLCHVSTGQDRGFTGSCPMAVFSLMAHTDMLLGQRKVESKTPNNLYLYIF